MHSARKSLANNQNSFLGGGEVFQDSDQMEHLVTSRLNGMANSQDIEDLIGITLELESRVEGIQAEIRRIQDIETRIQDVEFQLKDSLELLEEERTRTQDAMRMLLQSELGQKKSVEGQKKSVEGQKKSVEGQKKSVDNL